MEKQASAPTMIASILVYLSSLNTFQMLCKMISSFLLSYMSLFRCFFLLSEEDSKVQFEPSYDQDQGMKQGTRFDDETDDGWSLVGEDVNLVMKSLGIEKDGVFRGEEVNKRWGCDEISRVFNQEEEVRMEEVREAFDVFDQDKDGFIDAGELQRVLLALGLSQGADLNACRQMIRVFDDNGDGKIDFHEFVRLFDVE